MVDVGFSSLAHLHHPRFEPAILPLFFVSGPAERRRCFVGFLFFDTIPSLHAELSWNDSAPVSRRR
jgi:hypothetical protein